MPQRKPGLDQIIEQDRGVGTHMLPVNWRPAESDRRSGLSYGPMASRSRAPGFIGRVERTRQVHGRVAQAHINAEAVARDDGLDD